MTNRSRTYLLIEDRLGKPLQATVLNARRNGDSWNAIARELHAKTQVAINAETLRIWFFEDDKPIQAELAAARASA